MIPTILIIALAIYWLLKETDYLRIHLLVGAYYPPIEYQRKTWDELKPYTVHKNSPMWLTSPASMEPLCGLDWLENTMHVVPEYKIQLNFGTIKHDINVKPEHESILKDVMKFNTQNIKPRKLPCHKSTKCGAINPNWERARFEELMESVDTRELVTA